MRNKKLLAMASLLCTATLCAGVGVAALGNEANTVVSAETPVYTKTIDGVEYTFEQDFNNLVYSELGDVVNNMAMKTAEGATLAPTSHMGAAYGLTYCNAVAQADSTFVKSTGGLQFQFSITGGQTNNLSDRTEFYFGDIKLNMNRRIDPAMQFELKSFASGSSVDITFLGQPFTNGAAYLGWGTQAKIASMTEKGADGRAYMKEGFATLKIHKNKCTAIGGDTSAASGYWLSLSVITQGATEESVLYSGYLNNAMYTDTYDSIGLGFSSPNESDNYMTVKNTTTTAAVEEVAVYDIADYNPSHALTNEYVMGKTLTAEYNRWAVPAADYDLSNNNEKGSIGLEFRMKQDANGMGTTQWTNWAFMRIDLGTLAFILNYRVNYTGTVHENELGFEIYNKYNSANNSIYAVMWNGSAPAKYVVGNEYVIRVTRQAIRSTVDNSLLQGLVRVYWGQVDSTTGQPVDGWDATPIIEVTDTMPFWSEHISANNVGVCLQKTGDVAFDMTISSNKYVGVQTSVNDVVSVNKIVRGGNFTFADLTADTIVHAGWSKGADVYSPEDFIANGTKLENVRVTDTNVYRALTMTLKADKAASLRIRKRGENPHEVSLNWAVTATDANSLGEYFGGISFGYKLTAKNTDGQTASTEEEVLKYTDGYTTPYAYSITQSNITSEYYDMKFVCQAYVELNGVKYYTELPDVDVDGRSVESVVTAALADVVATATEKDGYVNAVEVNGATKYTYLQAWQYNFLKNYIA